MLWLIAHPVTIFNKKEQVFYILSGRMENILSMYVPDFIYLLFCRNIDLFDWNNLTNVDLNFARIFRVPNIEVSCNPNPNIMILAPIANYETFFPFTLLFAISSKLFGIFSFVSSGKVAALVVRPCLLTSHNFFHMLIC